METPPMPFRARPVLTAVAVLLAPATAVAAPHSKKPPRSERMCAVPAVAEAPAAASAAPCVDAPVEVSAGAHQVTLSLARCDGTAVPLAVERLSALARRMRARKSKTAAGADGARAPAAPDAPAPARALDGRVAERLEKVVDHFRRPGSTPHVVLVTGHAGRGVHHVRGLAIDFSIDGVDTAKIAAFCQTLPDTGCGHSLGKFVHLDVREPGTGTVAWTMGPHGDRPHVVARLAPAATGTSLPDLPAAAAEVPAARPRVDRHVHAL